MIFHIASEDEWREAQRAGSYRRSTAGRSLEEEGFIHLATAGQVAGVAQRFFAGRTDTVLLVVDPDRLVAGLRWECPPGSAESFPHLYGPLNLDAVVEVRAVALPPGGSVIV